MVLRSQASRNRLARPKEQLLHLDQAKVAALKSGHEIDHLIGRRQDRSEETATRPRTVDVAQVDSRNSDVENQAVHLMFLKSLDDVAFPEVHVLS